MKTVIIYYSLEGNTGYAADRIARILDADTIRLTPKKAYRDRGFLKFFLGGKSSVMKESPALEDSRANISQYDTVIFGSPVWAANFAPPLRTFISENRDALKGKVIAAFVCESGSGGEKALMRLKELLGTDAFISEAVFIDPLSRRSEKTDGMIDGFAERISGSGQE